MCDDDDMDRKRKDHDLDYIKLITFLHKVSRNEKEDNNTRRINLGRLFKTASVENFSEVPGEKHLPHNSNLTTLIYTVLIQKAERKKIQQFVKYIIKAESTIYDLEDLLWKHLLEDEDRGALDKVKEVVEQEQKDVDFINTTSDENTYSIYEMFLLRLELYYADCENEDVKKVFDYIKKITISISDLDQNLLEDWKKTTISIPNVVAFAQENKKVMMKYLGVSEKKYNTIVYKKLPKYFEFTDNIQAFDGLYVWAMIEEIKDSLGGKLDKDMVNFYRAGTTVFQKTLSASLSSGNVETPHIVRRILLERVKLRYIAYLKRLPEYFKAVDILEKFREKAKVITRSKNFGQLFIYGAMVFDLFIKIKEILEEKD